MSIVDRVIDGRMETLFVPTIGESKNLLINRHHVYHKPIQEVPPQELCRCVIGEANLSKAILYLRKLSSRGDLQQDIDIVCRPHLGGDTIGV
jgi:hypothetical protein